MVQYTSKYNHNLSGVQNERHRKKEGEKKGGSRWDPSGGGGFHSFRVGEGLVFNSTAQRALRPHL